jgi:uroporphyrinogen decarboxylase
MWGTVWDHHIFGRAGTAIDVPIKDVKDYRTYNFPPPPAFVTDPAAFESEKRLVEHQKENYVSICGQGFSLLQKPCALRGYVNFLCDLQDDLPEVNDFLDRLVEYHLPAVKSLVALGVDAVHVGDDYGTQRSPVMSEELFRRAILPRMKRLMAPAREAGVLIHFHSCGRLPQLFPCLEEIGATSIWPQLPAYDMEELAALCAKHCFALAIHTDRSQIMTRGTPDDVRAMVRR